MKFTAICALFVVAAIGSPTPPPNVHSNVGRTQRIPLNSKSNAANGSRVFDPSTMWEQLGFVHRYVWDSFFRQIHQPDVN
jgi:hypothetical protein